MPTFSLFSTFILMFRISVTESAPLPQEKLPPKETEDFMKRFGYIETGPGSADALYTEEGFKAAVQQMQRFGGLPETGELDEATLNLTKARRCGVPDVVKHRRTKRYIIGSEAWRKKTLTYFLANWPVELDPEVTRQKLAKALNLWSEVTPLRFVPRESMDADLIIAFGRGSHGDGYPFDGPGSILAHAFFPYEHDNYGGDVHFDDDEDWIDGSAAQKNTDGVDFYTVAAHEIGHSLGLAHSTVPGSIMFPYYKGYNARMTLDYDDIMAMYSMYVLNANFDQEPNDAPARSDPQEPRTRGDSDNPRKDEDDDQEDYGHGSDDSYSPRDDGQESDDSYNPRDDETSYDEDSYGSKNGGTTVGDVDVHVDEYDDRFSPNDYESGQYTDAPIPEPEDKETTTVLPEVPKTTTTKPTVNNKPDLCEGTIDAASLIRGELFVFKGMYMWRFRQRGQLSPQYPVYFHTFFRGFPWSVTSIDAVYQTTQDYNIIFFTGRYYWIFDGNQFTADSPLPLTNLGLPEDLDKVDAAMVWAKNGKTYFFSRDLYWRYDEKVRSMDSGYPQRMSRWRGAPNPDATFTWTDQKTYFFKDKEFWRFNNRNVTIDPGFPLPTAPYWFDCPS